MFLKWVNASILIIALIFGVFGVTTNLMGNSVDLGQCDTAYCTFRAISSDENKFNPDILSRVQIWLGLVFSVLWIFILKVIGYYGSKKKRLKFQTASDFAIKIENLPKGEYDEKDLIKHFKGLMTSEEEEESQIPNRWFKSVQIVYNME